ncbi:hypothetical protein JOF38_004112 [Paenarthrobacter nicotinovorans]|nr:hypothetical protein [Paenarthrobacter nicotinovorans]
MTTRLTFPSWDLPLPPVSAEGAMKVEWRTHVQASSAVEELVAAQESLHSAEARLDSAVSKSRVVGPPLVPNCLHLGDRQSSPPTPNGGKKIHSPYRILPSRQYTSRYHDAAEYVREAGDKVVCHNLCHGNYGNVCQLNDGTDKESTWPAYILPSPALNAINDAIRPMGTIALSHTLTKAVWPTIYIMGRQALTHTFLMAGSKTQYQA